MLKELNLLIAVILLACIGCTQQEGRDEAQTDRLKLEVFPQMGHSGDVSAVAISPDGKYIISSSGDKNLKLWDAATGKEIRTFIGHTNRIHSIAISPDGKYVISGSDDKTLKMWDIITGQVIKAFEGHSNYIHYITISPDGKYALSAEDYFNTTVKVWDITTGQVIKTFHTDYNIPITVSLDWKYAISGINNTKLELWDITTGGEIRTFAGHTSWVYSVSISPDGKYALSSSWAGDIKLWDIATGNELRTFEGHTNVVYSVNFSPDGKYVISGSNDRTVKLWDITTGHELRTFERSGAVYSVSFSPDGKYVLIYDGANLITLLDITTGMEIRAFNRDPLDPVYSVTINPDGKFALFNSGDGILRLWDIATGRMIKTFEEHSDYIFSVIISTDGKHAYTGAKDGIVKLWDMTTGQEIGTFEWNDYHTTKSYYYDIPTVTISPDGKYAVSQHPKGGANFFWELATGNVISNSMIGNTSISPDGKLAFSRDWDYTINLQELATGKKTTTFEGHNGDNPKFVIFTPDGKQVLLGFDNNPLGLWDTATGQVIKTFEEHTDSVRSVSISPDGKYALSGSNDRTLKLWDIATEQAIRTFAGHTDDINSATFISSKEQVISASNDGTVRIWDIATSKEIASFISFTDGEWIVITPDGYYNASPKGDEHLNVRIGNEVFGIDQFAAAFYQPEVVEARLQGKKDDPPIVKSRGDIRQATAPPGVDINVINQDALTDTAELAITIYDQFKPIGKTDIEITVNGRLIGESELQAAISAKGIKPENTRLLASSKEQKLEFTIPVKLEPGSNFIEVIAANDYSYGFKRIILNTPETEIQPKGDLRILAIGVNNYTKNKLKSGFDDLRYPASDIEKIIDSFKDQEGSGKRYDKVHTLIISDYEPIKPSKQSILANLEFLKDAGPNDTVLLFLSGHGKTENEVYYFLPSDTVFTGNGRFDPRSAVNVETLVKALDIPGRKIVMLDTCDSGGADTKNRLVRTLKNRSTVVFTACQDGEKAYEIKRYGGYFAHSMAEGISGRAASENMVQIIPLGEYITERVAALNKETGTPPQNPVKYIPDGYQNFVISMVE